MECRCDSYHRSSCGSNPSEGAEALLSSCSGAALTLNQPCPFPLPWTAQPTATEFDIGILALHQLHPQDIWTGSLWWCLSFLGTVLSGNSTTTDLWDHRDTVSWGDLLMERCRELGRNLPSQRVPGILNGTQSSCEQKKCPKAKSNNNKIKK